MLEALVTMLASFGVLVTVFSGGENLKGLEPYDNFKAQESHWSFRDGCEVRPVVASNGNYKFASYDHCKSLPRVYDGKVWKPPVS